MALGFLKKYAHQVRIPTGVDKIYKDECIFSFDSPESETGLYVCMNTYLGFGKKYVEKHFRKTGNCVYLHMRRIKKEIPAAEKKESEEKKITRLAIGVEGGFDPEGKKYEYDEINSIVLLPDYSIIPLPNTDLPEQVQLAVASILAAESAARLEEAQALAGTWDGEKRPISKHAENLVQLNGIKIPPRGWKCQNCDKTDNLWLNLTDGSILCGRRFFDGSGGNNHALEHYKISKYPLAVKLGTITPDGADVYSYDEDEMVEDPYLTKHLSHFGINIAQMEKTDKSMIELEIDMNQRIGEWATIQEAGCNLIPVYGSGYTGLANLGNSCYLNSVMQVVFVVPAFKARYVDCAEDIFNNAPPDPTSDLTVQMAKLGHGLLSGDYSKSPLPGSDEENYANEGQPGIKLNMFKSLIGKGHPEFSTKRQQDAQEFFLHLINMLERNNRGDMNPANSFKYQEENRILCIESGKVKYVSSTQYILRLPIPMEAATNKDEYKAYLAKKKDAEEKGVRLEFQEMVRACIPMSACLELLAAPKIVPDFYSSALKAKTMASKTTKMCTFPEYLMVQLDKFTFENDWIPKKLDVSIDVPDELDLGFLRGTGLQSNEELLPEEAAQSAEVHFDENMLLSLTEMGFPIDACKKAIFNTGNQGLENAMSWIMEHMNDADFGDPFIPPGGVSLTSSTYFVPNEEAVQIIMAMGFTRDQTCKALKATDNNVERAADWIFSHLEEIDTEQMDTNEVPLPQAQYRDGPAKYRLIAFISHMGTSTMVGHYVCHILKEGRWVIFNDNKVALSESPPKDLGYLYLYQRIQS